MAIIGVQKSFFFMYASFDKSYITLEVNCDSGFTINMLKSLKSLYFNTMIHEICLRNENDKENCENNNNQV